MGLFKRGALSCVHEKPFGQILNFPYNLFSLSIAMQVPCVQTAAGRAGASGTILPHQHRLPAGPDRREAPLPALQAKILKQHPKIKPAPCRQGAVFFGCSGVRGRQLTTPFPTNGPAYTQSRRSGRSGWPR